MAFPQNQQVQEERQRQQQQQQQQFILKQEKRQEEEEEEEDINIDIDTGTPIRYLPLRHVYSATSPCVSASGSSNVMSKKVKARKLVPFDDFDQKLSFQSQKPPIVYFYSRRAKKPRHSPEKPSFFNSLIARAESESKWPVKIEHRELDEVERRDDSNSKVGTFLKKKRKFGSNELVKLGVDSSVLRGLDGPRLREVRKNHISSGISRKRKRNSTENSAKEVSGSACAKRWVG